MCTVQSAGRAPGLAGRRYALPCVFQQRACLFWGIQPCQGGCHRPVLPALAHGLSQPYVDLGLLCVPTADQVWRASHWLAAAGGAGRAGRPGCQKHKAAGCRVNVLLQQKAGYVEIITGKAVVALLSFRNIFLGSKNLLAGGSAAWKMLVQ